MSPTELLALNKPLVGIGEPFAVPALCRGLAVGITEAIELKTAYNPNERTATATASAHGHTVRVAEGIPPTSALSANNLLTTSYDVWNSLQPLEPLASS